jgi:hypothetical protein
MHKMICLEVQAEDSKCVLVSNQHNICNKESYWKCGKIQILGKISTIQNCVKGKVKLSLCLTKHYVMKACGGVDV